MAAVIPRNEMEAPIEPHDFSSERGRSPRKIEAMLRMYLLQTRFSPPDVGVKGAVYNSYALKQFLDEERLSEEQVPARRRCTSSAG